MWWDFGQHSGGLEGFGGEPLFFPGREKDGSNWMIPVVFWWFASRWLALCQGGGLTVISAATMVSSCGTLGGWGVFSTLGGGLTPSESWAWSTLILARYLLSATWIFKRLLGFFELQAHQIVYENLADTRHSLNGNCCVHP